tara:strand:+ start:4143 stop:5426 length:1284 start_codon:yes stop_codon:yes gene_type:complete
MKYCANCKNIKEKNEYYKNKARKDGVDVYCIVCRKEKEKYKQEQKIQKRLQKQFIDGEIWKDITEFNGYECSTEGRIRNKTTCKLLKPCVGCAGYTVSHIRNKNFKFHRIIAQTFLPNFKDKATVEHKDDNKLNNKLYNLKWATYKEQAEYVKKKNTRNSQIGIKIGTSDLTNLKNEIWKNITDYPEYEISNMGRIKYPIRKGNKPYIKRITYGGNTGDGYRSFRLKHNNKKFYTVIHRLVAKEFLPNPNNYKIVNHIDGIKKNNNVNNLEWCSRSYNTQHGYDNNLISGKREIYQLDVNNNIIKKWSTIKDAYISLKLSRTAINKVLSGRNKTSGGYYWCYKEEYDISKKNHTKYDANKIKIKQINKETKGLIKIWDSISEASKFIAKENKSSIKAIKSNISQCVRGKRNSCHGFKWEYYIKKEGS